MKQLSMRCPVCEGNDFIPGAEFFDDRYGEPNRYKLSRCSSCGHIATAPRLAEVDLPILYETYYPRKKISVDDVVNQASQVKNSFAEFFRWLNGTDNQGHYGVHPGEVMLDVGCGSGVSLLEAKALGAIAFGIEADSNVKRIAAQLDLNIHFGSLHDQPFPEQSFDLIVMNQVIEHLPDPDYALVELRKRLAANGRIVLVLPNRASLWRCLFGRSWINWHIPYHLHHFHRKTFEVMAQRCGFRVERFRTITPNLWTLLQFRVNLHNLKRGESNPIWRVAENPNASGIKDRKADKFRALLRLVALPNIAVINRVVDFFGMGDSLMVELKVAF